MKAPSPVAVLVKLRLDPAKLAEFKDRLRAVLELVRQEPACLSISSHQDPADPTCFMLYELWRSRSEFEEFVSEREYLQSYMATVKPWWSHPREFSIWDQLPA